MRGAGIVWFFRKEVASILSQFQIAVHSQWDISHNTTDYKRLGKLGDLCYNARTSEGIRCKFSPVSKGLHVARIDENTDGCFFGRRIPDNSANFGMAIYYTILSGKST